MCAVVWLPSCEGLNVTFWKRENNRVRWGSSNGIIWLPNPETAWNFMLNKMNKKVLKSLFAMYLLVILKKTTSWLLLRNVGVEIWWWQVQLFSLPTQSLVFSWICWCSCGWWAQSHTGAEFPNCGTSVWGDPTRSCHRSSGLEVHGRAQCWGLLSAAPGSKFWGLQRQVLNEVVQ